MSTEPTPIKLLTFNIQHGRGMNGVVDLEKTAQVIEQTEADIVSLQEVDRFFSKRSDYRDQFEWLKERLGMEGVFGAAIDIKKEEGRNKQYGNAVLSKHPIEYYGNHQLESVFCESEEVEPRAVLEAVLRINGQRMAVFNTHLSLEEREQFFNAQQLREIVDRTTIPSIVTGDFNAVPTSLTLGHLTYRMKDAFEEAGTEEGHTFPAPFRSEHDTFTPHSRIDYVLTNGMWSVVQLENILTDASDHLPVLAKLQLNNEKNLSD